MQVPSWRRAFEAQDVVMETWDALRARRNVRQFTDRPVPEEGLDRILEAGRRAPSASNWQPWDFVLVTDRAQLVELAKVWQGAGHVARGRGRDRDRRADWRRTTGSRLCCSSTLARRRTR